MHRFQHTLLAAVAVVGLSTGAAEAVPTLNGTFGFTGLGETTYTPPGLLSNATTITLPAADVVNSIGPSYLGQPNDLLSFMNVGDSVSFPTTTTLTEGVTPSGVLVTFDNSRYQFDANSMIWEPAPTTDGIGLYFSGTFHDTEGTYEDSSASLSLALTQSGGITGTVNYSGAFASPPDPVPEPVSMAAFGIGILGLAFVRRRAQTISMPRCIGKESLRGRHRPHTNR